MKALKWILGAFVAGQTLILWKKDEGFKEGVEKKQGLDKVGFIFERLFHFNQELFNDTKKTLKNLDIDAELNKAKDVVSAESKKLKSFLDAKTTQVETMSTSKADEVVNEAEKRYNALYSYVHGYATDMIEKYSLQAKLDEVKQTYDILKKKVNDIKKA